MIDIKLIRENPEIVKKSLENRNAKFNLDEIISIDSNYRKVLQENEELKSKRNKVSDEIGKNPPNKGELIKEMQVLKQEIKEGEENVKKIEVELFDKLLYIPNLLDDSVPIGKSAEDNKVVREYSPKSEVRSPGSENRRAEGEVLDHQTIGEGLKILDFEAASKLSGSRFVLLKGDGAKLERAIINFMLDIHVSRGYKEIFPPFIVDKKCLVGTGQLPKFEEELYKCGDGVYLIPTAEVPLTNIHRDEILSEEQLPINYVAYTACFRQEAGSYGKDTRGLIRNHQFNKVELVKYVKPEDSTAEHEKMLSDAEEILKQLELTYRVVELCTADLGFSSSKTYDLEVWMPGEKNWREISSISNCKDFQARRLNCKFRRDKKPEFVHTLNGSGVAVGRTFAAILENFQNKDGSVSIPKNLIKYFGKDKIGG
ncbi:MAG: serine--tRNA ligase [Elusimicrobia bacterium]|nr:serine--tRNA ligase [Elusimicrobiota bacterium]